MTLICTTEPRKKQNIFLSFIYLVLVRTKNKNGGTLGLRTIPILNQVHKNDTTLKHTPDLVKHLLIVCLLIFPIFATFGERTVVAAAAKSSDCSFKYFNNDKPLGHLFTLSLSCF